MADVEFKIGDEKLWNLVCKGEGTFTLVSKVTDMVASNANSISSGFRTGLYYRDHKAPPVGNTAPVYKHSTRRTGRTITGLVVTGNYAAMKDNHLHNTLLKSL